MIPLNLPEAALKRLYDLADGILLSGGGDLDPTLYGQTAQADLSDVQPDRDQLEIEISRWAAADGKPLLAICRGIQVLAVAHGGTICQDIPSQLPQATRHQYRYLDDELPQLDALLHEVDFKPGCRLVDIFQTNRLAVNSLHHQAVLSVGPTLQVVGHSNDGIIEALEHPDHPFYCGVQWHPELLTHQHPTARQLFSAFIAACVSGQ